MLTDKGWEIDNARTFTAVGESCSDVVKKLKLALKDAGIRNRDTASLVMEISFGGGDFLGFEGTVTVVVA